MFTRIGTVGSTRSAHRTDPQMPESHSDSLTIKVADELFSVSPNTLRNWGASVKVAEYRHAVNNYRLFRRKDICELAKRLERPVRANRIRKPR